MGFDFSFHPLKLGEEGAMIRGLLSGSRSASDVVKSLPNCTGDLAETVEQNLLHLQKCWRTNSDLIASTVSYMAGMLSGYLRPYWYSRGQGITTWIEKEKIEHRVFTPFLDWLGAPFSNRFDRTNGLVPENFSGSGVIAEPAAFLEWFDAQDFEDRFDIAACEAVRNCSEYSIKHGCQMIEVADVYTIGGTSTNPDNVRTYYLGD